jgi:hypothetical protein
VTPAIDWHDFAERVSPFIFRITTPSGSGTGFLVSRSEAGDLCGVATAAHVVSYAHEWEQLIKLEHFATGQSILLRPDNRAVYIEQSLDTAAIVFNVGDLNLPVSHPELIDEGKIIKVGVEVGWMGFPAVMPNYLCFFSGRISCHIESESAFLVDGVVINGVSGAPIVWLAYDHVKYIGVVSAYIPNKATGEALPGLSVVRQVSQFQSLVKQFRSLDDARRQQQIQQEQEQQEQIKQELPE